MNYKLYILRNKIDKRIYIWKIDLSLFRETTLSLTNFEHSSIRFSKTN